MGDGSLERMPSSGSWSASSGVSGAQKTGAARAARSYVQGRWYCAYCRKLCTGALPVGEEPIHRCGAVMRRVASIWEVEEEPSSLRAGGHRGPNGSA
jgi:hypothetical protein